MQIVYLCLALALLSLSFVVVLNSAEQPSTIYAGSNVRFLASLPSLLLLLSLTTWFFPEPLAAGFLDWFLLIAVLGLFVAFCAWIESRYKAGIFKRVMNAVVVDKQGKAIDYKKALLRNSLKVLLLPVAPFNLYVLMKDFRRQALHDKWSGTFVMWTADTIRANQPKSDYEVNISS